MIDLLKLNYLDKIEINEDVEITKDYLENTDIVSLSKIKTVGSITFDPEDNYLVKLEISGTMDLHDSLTYDIIPYGFKVNIEETLENSMKTLDLIEFLWHYIVLEVPLRFTNSKENYVENENYRVISEEEYSKKNNPFKEFFDREE
jgi:uncharacterized metal-binding protein YceD (DUF177 family)